MIDPKNIGGSSAAAVLGISPWESQLSLYERLRGTSRAKEWAEEEAARLEAGKHNEPLILARATKIYGARFWAAEPHISMLVHPKNPRIVGHIDARLEGGDIAEFKMSGSSDGWGEPDTDQVPPHYLAQALHYLMLDPSASRVVFFVLRVPSFRLYRYVVERDGVMIGVLEQRCLEMLERVDAGHPPDPSEEAEARALWFAADPTKAVVADSALQFALARRWAASRMIGVLEKIVSRANLDVLKFVKDAGAIVNEHGDPIATVKPDRTFDAEEFARRFPELAAQCQTLDSAKARKFRAEYDACMRQPTAAGESKRPIRLSREFTEACRRLISGEACKVPLLPEVVAEKLTEET